jgi:transcriptional regulator with XRE-family HTH domain
MGLGSKLKRLREYLDFSQEKLAASLGVKKSHISNIENDKSSLSFEKLAQIVSTYKVDARYFFDQLDGPEESDLSKRGVDPRVSPIEALRNDVKDLKERWAPPSGGDEVTQRVQTNADLYELVSMIRFWDSATLRRFRDMAFSYMQGRQDEKKVRRLPPAEGEATATGS